MPFLVEQYMDDITYRLTVIRVELTSNNSLGRYNSNKRAEDFFCGLLNLIFDWHLVNINHTIREAPGIDLIDTDNKIAIQVSSTATHNKIQSSIDILNTMYPYMNNCHFYMMVITSKQSKYLKSFNNKYVQFDKENDIWDIDDLLEIIQNLPIEKLEQISTYIKKEYGLLSLSLDPHRGGNQITMSGAELENNPYLFICYCHQDRSKVFPILHKFKEAGMRYWYDDDLAPGVNYSEKIESAIDYCQGAIIFLTNNAVESEWCRNEIQDCLDEKRGYVIPVFIERATLRYGLRLRLRSIEYFDLSNESANPNSIDQLINTLRKTIPEAFKQKDTSETINSPEPKIQLIDKEQNPSNKQSLIRNDLTFTLGKYPQSVKGKAIGVDWKVIGYDSQRKQLVAISKLILDVQPYDNRSNYKGLLKWEDTSLYSWIHDVFFNTLFSEAEKKIIKDITILNEAELQELFSSNKSRKAAGSNYSIICKGLHTDDRFYDAMGEYGQWWIRTDSILDSKCRRVFCDGAIYPRGRKITRTDIGVRPVIKIDSTLLSEAKIKTLKKIPLQ